MALLSESTLRFVQEHRTADVRTLALQASRYPEVDMPLALTQIAGWQIAKAKIPTWAATEGLLYPVHLSMEQCSSEVTARYKAEVVKRLSPHPVSLVDLTGGFGIDCSFLAEAFRSVTYVERQEALCEIARHNFAVLNQNHIRVENGDAVAFLQEMQAVDWLFIDPARRDGHGGKTVAIADCEPDVAFLEETMLQRAGRVLVKLSPMLDLSLALQTLRHVAEAHIVSVDNECKELLLVLQADVSPEADDVPIHCVNLSGDEVQTLCFTRRQEQQAVCTYASPAGYLYEPNASILKAGAYRSLAADYEVKKLHPNSHLYTSSHYLPRFPGRRFRIEAVGGFGKKEVKELLGSVKKANLTVRNFPASVVDLRKRLKLSEGGDTYLFATTLSDESRILIRCSKLFDANCCLK